MWPPAMLSKGYGTAPGLRRPASKDCSASQEASCGCLSDGEEVSLAACVTRLCICISKRLSWSFSVAMCCVSIAKSACIKGLLGCSRELSKRAVEAAALWSCNCNCRWYSANCSRGSAPTPMPCSSAPAAASGEARRSCSNGSKRGNMPWANSSNCGNGAFGMASTNIGSSECSSPRAGLSPGAALALAMLLPSLRAALVALPVASAAIG
mmetsp:Transcript_113565/g.242403  ORF Transcript_113565/g.242403 Transcript_113565/m.242403 type:complete len:210 (-) Transcript_113565:739-1368(-)